MSLIEKIDERIKKHERNQTLSLLDTPTYYCHSSKLSEAIAIKELILSEQKKPLTIGDKIRESNESLAKFIKKYNAQYIDDCYCRSLCEHRVDGHCNIEECDRSNYNGISEYLNQPIES